VAGDAQGTPFGRYRLIEMLGRGGMGEVWRAYDPVNNRFVALKVLPANYADDPVFQERFRREAHAAAGLDEPHVVPIYDSGEIDGRLFVSMRLVKGDNLQELLDDGPLPPARAVAIIDQIASALHAAHRIGLVHRDVKPSNILVAEDDFAYLIDFGIARAAGEQGLTSTGSTVGTWAYMAPERFQKSVADARGDIYALACVLHQALTGEQPFPAGSLEQIAVAHMLQPTPRPSELQTGLPAAMDDVIATGMAKDPQQRYATTKDLARAARATLSARAEPISRIPDPPPTAAARLPREPTPDHAAPATEQADPLPVTMPAAPIAPGPEPTWAATHQAPIQHRARVEPPPGDGSAPMRPAPRRRAMILTVVGVTTAVVIGIVVLVVTNRHEPAPSGSQTRPSAAGSQPVSVATNLPFTGLQHPSGVAVDSTGAVYVTDSGNNRILKLAAGSTTPTVLPFTGLYFPVRVAVDSTGAVYVVDSGHKRVVKLDAGSTTQTELPFTGLNKPVGVAVDSTGAVYVVDSDNNRVLKLAAGSTTQTGLPFTVFLKDPDGVAVDDTGAVYVVDSGNNRVLKLDARSSNQTELPFNGLFLPESVAVDGTGAIYVTDPRNTRVVRLAAGSTTQTVLSTGLNNPVGVAVDGARNVYVTDYDGNRVVRLQQP
jgi:serine/threonine protein kinase, bacterial